MKYLSTRGGESEVSFTSVLLNGLAKDGGLYIPKSLPKFTSEDLKQLSHMSYPELCYEVTKGFMSESDIPLKSIKKFVLIHMIINLGKTSLILINYQNMKIFLIYIMVQH